MEVDDTPTQATKFSRLANGKIGTSMMDAVDGSRLRNWQQSSRIIRVSRASGGKDRHSKVWTARGPRDRRIRLSVGTAIQFYDLQDRLGLDQPSKAVEWLIKTARDSIDELPSLNGVFPETPTQQSDEKQGLDSRSSACSSNSETTSKGSRNENRVKARERARERAVMEKMECNPQNGVQSSSFTQLLTAGIGNMENAGGVSSSSMDNYFNATGLNQAMMTVSPFSLIGGENQNQNHELQHFPSLADHYNLNFLPSTALGAGFDSRRTLQSNFSSPQLDNNTTMPFFLVDNQDHQHATSLFPPALHQLYYGGQQSDQKGKGKN